MRRYRILEIFGLQPAKPRNPMLGLVASTYVNGSGVRAIWFQVPVQGWQTG